MSQLYQLSQAQQFQLIQIVSKRYINPYKVIYMISQPQSDSFKSRNQSHGCCSSSSITIPKHQQTKTQLFLSQAIQQLLMNKNLNLLLEELENKFQNVRKNGVKDNLKVDQHVEKFLIQKIMDQGINMKLFQIVKTRLKRQGDTMANSAMLWATPNTWYARFPNTKLQFLSPQTLTHLNNQKTGYAIQKDFLQDYKQNLLKQLKFLERDGRFQQLLWSKSLQHLRNDKKILCSPQNYAIDGSEQSYIQGQLTYPNLKKSLLTLRSIPFQLNQKVGLYCTISQNNQISYFKENVFYKVKTDLKSSRFSTFCPVGNWVTCKLFQKDKDHSNTPNDQIRQQIHQIQINNGDLLIVDNQLWDLEIQTNAQQLFLFKSWVCTIAKHK